ncbi:MAG TPA: helix-hairpin-helix domain-containing protein [Burkholderiaceae bacterium]|nr:helix-hairpin-helix domain-containing protein [Burkholderiaceae bacterium]
MIASSARVIKSALGIALATLALAGFAAVDVNAASQAELETVKGIGPGLSARILDERQRKGPFKDWADFVARVKGVGAGAAAKFSADGLRIGDAPHPAASVAVPTK